MLLTVFDLDLPVLDDKVIKKTNRLQQSKAEKVKKQLLGVRARQKRDAEREAHLTEMQKKLNEESDSDEDLDFYDGVASPDL